MPSNVAAKTVTPVTTPAPVNSAKPAVIATRRRCEADGVGLSHYILLDRKGK